MTAAAAEAGTGRRSAGSATTSPALAAADTSTEHFPDVKTLMVEGTRVREWDALLSLEPGSLVVRSRNANTVLRTLSYHSITAATYARAKRPRGQTMPGALDVPENFGGAGIFGSSRHWLTLQTAGEFLVIRLEDRNMVRVLTSVEARTGLKVRRNPGD